MCESDYVGTRASCRVKGQMASALRERLTWTAVVKSPPAACRRTAASSSDRPVMAQSSALAALILQFSGHPARQRDDRRPGSEQATGRYPYAPHDPHSSTGTGRSFLEVAHWVGATSLGATASAEDPPR